MDVEKTKFNSDELHDYLNVYYKLLFPFKLFYKWLSYGDNTKYFGNREFSFTLVGDVYIRYLSFSSSKEFRDAVLRKMPEKIDLGAVFSVSPAEAKKKIVSCVPVERELVFDIDMNDYDDVRTCCSGTDICEKCWPFLIVAAKILHRILTADFGFKNVLFVYSGRRGIHVWVADKRARALSDRSRSAIVSYINLIEGGAYMKKKVSLDGFRALHPSIKQSLAIIDKHFEKLILENQKKFASEKSTKQWIDLCVDSNLRNLLTEKLIVSDRKFKNAADRWIELTELVASYYTPSTTSTKVPFIGKYFVEELKLQLCYPRLDANVSRSLNHLLKTPFSVHPKTGRVCVPIDINEIDRFDPFKVPTISTLCNQINEFDAKLKASDAKRNLDAHEKTSLRASMKVFERFVADLEKESVKKRNLDDMDF